MEMSHKVLRPVEYQGTEPFTVGGSPTARTVLDFWRWMGSNLLDNTMGGILAEYIVASALGIEGRREPWVEDLSAIDARFSLPRRLAWLDLIV